MKQHFTYFLLAVAVCLTGCAATVQRQAGSEAKLTLSPVAAKRVVMVVSESKAATASPDWEAFRGEWRNAMAASAAASGLSFSYQETAPTDSPVPATLGT
jgi:hypothetical protein